jgi:hypothetical protein
MIVNHIKLFTLDCWKGFKMEDDKYTYLWVIQGDYGSGWEDIDQDEHYCLMLENLKCYNKNEPGYTHRLINRRVLNQ